MTHSQKLPFTDNLTCLKNFNSFKTDDDDGEMTPQQKRSSFSIVKQLQLNSKKRKISTTFIEFLFWYLHSKSKMSGWPSGLRRQTQEINSSLHRSENSGPRMRAWVRIPLLTENVFWCWLDSHSRSFYPKINAYVYHS